MCSSVADEIDDKAMLQVGDICVARAAEGDLPIFVCVSVFSSLPSLHLLFQKFLWRCALFTNMLIAGSLMSPKLQGPVFTASNLRIYYFDLINGNIIFSSALFVNNIIILSQVIK